MNVKNLAEDILKNVGGEENIAVLTHCATRVRLHLKDNSKANIKVIDSLEGVLRAQIQNEQLQIVIGAKVNAVFNEICKITNIKENSQTIVKPVKGNIFKQIIDVFGGVFVPLLPIIIGCGLLKSISAMLTTFGLVSSNTSFITVINMMGDIIFYFLPFFLAISAAKKFNTDTFLSVAIAGAYMYPTIIDGAKMVATTGIKTIDFLGMPILLTGYCYTLLPIVFSVWILSYVNRFVDKIVPDMFKIMFNAILVLLIMIPLSLVVLGPIGSYLGVGIANGLSWLFSTAGFFAHIVFALVWLPVVLCGMHQAIMPFMMQQVSNIGYTPMLIAPLAAVFANTGAVLGVTILLKDKKQKAAAGAATLSAILGIGEPAIFGFTMKYKKPLYMTLIGAAIGAGYMGFFNGVATTFVAMPGLLTLAAFKASSFIHIIIGCTLSIVSACALTLVFGIEENQTEEIDSSKSEEGRKIVISSPIKGIVRPLSEINDSMFSQEVIGKGIAIEPLEGKVYAPIDGVVEAVYQTKHAIGFKSKEGVELLIHIGLDTVNLEGKYFTVHVEQGQEVKKGDLIVEFDSEAIKKAGYEIITPIVVTNTDKYKSIEVANNKSIDIYENLLTVIE